MITILIPGYVRASTGQRSRVEVAAGPRSVGEALEALFAAHPGARERIMLETGEVRPHVNIFVGTESIRWTGGLASPVRDGDEIAILPAVSGGAWTY